MADPRRPLIWSPDALADLAEIWDYYANTAGPQIANRMVREIEKSCRLLQQHPLAGRARDDVRTGLRSIVANPYVLFYRIAGDVPEVVRVLHGRRDLDEIFSDDPES